MMRLYFHIIQFAVLVSTVAGVVLFSTRATADTTCPEGVLEIYCSAFVHYQVGPRELDSRIVDGLGLNDGAQTRSIAFIIAIDHYPNLSNADVKAAAVDGERLTDFLINDQQFDEVILLKNDTATAAAISYFLDVYLPNRALVFGGKARLLIAYSGHGTYETGTTRPEFVLSQAHNLTDDVTNLYKMKTFADSVVGLAPHYFHVLTLINACYGANFFAGAAPRAGDPDGWNEPGAYAVTAGDTKTTVPSLDESRGSLFFDLLISGIQAGVADEEYFRYFALYGSNGELLQRYGIARTGAVENYLSTAFERINRDHLGKDKQFERLSHPWIGSTTNDPAAAGGFFFLMTHKTGGFDLGTSPLEPYAFPPKTGPKPTIVAFSASQITTRTALVSASLLSGSDPSPLAISAAPSPTLSVTIPAGPVSSVKGHPEIKVFKAPEVYPIHGLDLSSADGKVNWQTVAAQPVRPAFLYARAIGWAGVDPTFKDRWSHFAALGVDRGAYLKFDFCRTPEAQLSTLRAIVPPSGDLLPIAIELVTPEVTVSLGQYLCWKGLGAEGAKGRILAMAAAIETLYGKTPLVAGNHYNLGVLTDTRFDRYMIWLDAYGDRSGAMQFGGKNPWTIWQYSGTLKVKGIGPSTTGEVFFGTAAQYALFKAGQGNVALAAAQ
jgi:GH25 family lysozyme M1 (1,4-beta-N-acetylmuramidase)